jgi:hypothetical protein
MRLHVLLGYLRNKGRILGPICAHNIVTDTMEARPDSSTIFTTTTLILKGK